MSFLLAFPGIVLVLAKVACVN